MKKYISLFILFVAFVMSGCKKDFLDINTNPNQVVESSVSPDLALAVRLNATASRNAGTYAFLNRWLGYWSASGSYSRSSVEMSYNITNDFGAGIWSGTYYSVNQYKAIEKNANTLEWKFYEGISKIVQAFEMANLVDFYGNVPYTEAFNLSEFIRPKYDNGEEVYKALFTQIDAGVALIKAASLDKSIAIQDTYFKGDKTGWYKFANTLKLKMLIHTSKTSTFNVATEIGKIQAEGSGYLGAGLGVYAKAGYTADIANPFFRSHLFAQNGNEADDYNRANNFVLDLFKGLGDERYKYFFREAKSLPGQFRGTVYGSLPSDDLNSARTSGPGYGLAASATSDMWLMTSVEALFLRAEAVIRGWLPGDAQAAYRAAVTESFVTLNVPDPVVTATAYLNNISSRVAWPATGTTDEKIAVMAWQKYFALTGIQPNETWVDIRRLKVVQPALSVAPERGSNNIPVRLLYPQAEYNTNSESVKAQGTVNQFTTKIFWDK